MVCETEKPNLSGYSAKRRLRIVDFPVPLGPEMTIGGDKSVGAIVLRRRVVGGEQMFG